MSNPRPPLLRVLADRPAAWLAIPAVAALAGLVMLGQSLVSSPTANAQSDKPVASGSFSAQQRSDIEAIVKNYLVTHPEIFLEVQTALEAKMEQEQAARLKAVISQNARDIYRDPKADLAGNPDGDITVVEFFDYNCGYCKRGLGDIVKLVEADQRCASSSRSCRSSPRVRKKHRASRWRPASRANTGKSIRPC